MMNEPTCSSWLEDAQQLARSLPKDGQKLGKRWPKAWKKLARRLTRDCRLGPLAILVSRAQLALGCKGEKGEKGEKVFALSASVRLSFQS